MRLAQLAIIAGLGVAVAAPAAKAYTVFGVAQCPDIVREEDHEHFREYNKFWVLGYFSARNFQADSDTGSQIDNEQIYLRALQYCRKNPDKDLDDAARAIYDALN